MQSFRKMALWSSTKTELLKFTNLTTAAIIDDTWQLIKKPTNLSSALQRGLFADCELIYQHAISLNNSTTKMGKSGVRSQVKFNSLIITSSFCTRTQPRWKIIKLLWRRRSRLYTKLEQQSFERRTRQLFSINHNSQPNERKFHGQNWKLLR